MSINSIAELILENAPQMSAAEARSIASVIYSQEAERAVAAYVRTNNL